MQDALGSELFTILDMLDVALGMMTAISVEEKGPATCVVSAVVEYLRAWGRKKVIFRIDGEPATRALGVAIQHARSEEAVIDCLTRARCMLPKESLLCAGEDGPVGARAQEGQPAPPDPAAPNLISTSTVAQTGGVDTSWQ